MSENSGTFKWDVLLANRGLSRLATDIFLMVDLDTFARLEDVSGSWRRHFVEDSLWKKRFLAATEAGEYRSEVIRGDEDKERLSRCKPLS